MARGQRALRLVEYRPTAHRARAAQFAFGVGCVVGQREERSLPSHWLRLDCTNTATGRRYGLRTFVTTASGSYDARLARFQTCGEYRSTARGTRAAQCGLGVVVLWPNVRRAGLQAAG